jgi:hypothetical protein
MSRYILLFTIALLSGAFAQTVEIGRVTGSVKFISGGEDQWRDVKQGMKIAANSILSTEANSSVKLKSEDILFTLKESSAITVSNIKKMSLDELLLALAMENIINAPRKRNNDKSGNTAVYGTKVTDPENILEPSVDFGMKRLNGAKQLAENGMKESAIITAMEVYRKYPETKKDAANRIYFADLLYEKRLYEEAYDQYNEIKSITLNDSQAQYVSDKIDEISKKLLNR